MPQSWQNKTPRAVVVTCARGWSSCPKILWAFGGEVHPIAARYKIRNFSERLPSSLCNKRIYHLGNFRRSVGRDFDCGIIFQLYSPPTLVAHPVAPVDGRTLSANGCPYVRRNCPGVFPSVKHHLPPLDIPGRIDRLGYLYSSPSDIHHSSLTPTEDKKMY